MRRVASALGWTLLAVACTWVGVVAVVAVLLCLLSSLSPLIGA